MKILFLAMSGVRVYDPALLELGLTLPGFVERSRVIASLPSLGLLTLAGLCPEGTEVVYREMDDVSSEVAAREIAKESFDLVAMSSLTARIEDAYDLADRLRAEGVRVVLGGLHATAMPEEAASHMDAVVVGQGEPVWQALLGDLRRGALQKTYHAARTSNALSEPPLPRYDLLDIERYNRLTIQTARGCPWHCHFCAASRLLSDYRKKSLAHIRRDLDAIMEIWPKPFLELADDNTFVDKAWSRELVKLLGSYSTHWFTETDISVADDPALLDDLADSGCAQLLIGLESASSLSLGGVERHGWKLRQFDLYREKIARIQGAGISVNGCFILGFDHDDESIFERTLEFSEGLGLSEMQITLLTPFPGTDLHRTLDREGRLHRPVNWRKYTLFDLNFRPARMSEEQLEEGFRWLMSEVYNPARTAQRKANLRECLRHRRR